MLTQNQIIQIEHIGFSSKAGSLALMDFVNLHFPGLPLTEFVIKLDRILAPLTNARLFKEIDGLERDPPKLIVQYYSEDQTDERRGLCLARTFVRYAAEIVVDHDFFMLPEERRHQGNGKAILLSGLRHYLTCGISRVRIKTGLQDGGLVWAKLFFTATRKQEVDGILMRAGVSLSAARYAAVKKVYDVYYTRHPEGLDFPMVLWSKLPGMDRILRESSWNGELDLNNQNLLANFKLL